MQAKQRMEGPFTVTKVSDMSKAVRMRAALMGWTERVESTRMVMDDGGALVPAWGYWR